MRPPSRASSALAALAHSAAGACGDARSPGAELPRATVAAQQADEPAALHGNLNAGGLPVVDDFRGTRERAEDPMHPLEFSTYAHEMGANMIVCGVSY